MHPFSWMLRYLWALPTTLPGLAVAALTRATGGTVAVRQGVVEAHGGAARWLLRRAPVGAGGASGLTLGHVILAQTEAELAGCRAHEHVHVRQAERWGPLFLPAYAAASGWAWLRGGDPYLDNAFEREAYAAVECRHRPDLASRRWSRPAPDGDGHGPNDREA